MYKSLIIVTLVLLTIPAQAQNRRKVDTLRKILGEPGAVYDHYQALNGIINYYVNQSNGKYNLDTADMVIKQARQYNQLHNDNGFKEVIDIYVAKIYCMRNGNVDFEKIFLPVIAECRKSGDRDNERYAWENLCALVEHNDKLLPLQLRCYQHLMLIARQAKNYSIEIWYFRQIADVHLKQRKYDEAENELMQILKNYKKVSPKDVLDVYDLLTAVYIARGEYDKALSNALNTEKSMEMTGDSVVALNYYGRLAEIYSIVGQIPESIKWAKKSLNNVTITNQPYIYITCTYVVKGLIQEKKPREAVSFILDKEAKYKPLNLLEQSFLQKDLGDCYFALKKYALAQKSYQEMIKLCNEQNDISSRFKGTEYRAMGEFCLGTVNYKDAKGYLSEALKDYKAYGWIDNIKEVHLLLFKADSALGNYQSAIAHLQESNRLKDSMFTVAKNKQIAELNIKYHADEQAKNLKLAQGNEKLTKIQLEHSETTRNWVISGSGLLLIIAGLIYRQSRLRRKNNELIIHKNELLQHLLTEKEWLLKEVHHRVKNNLHTVICLLESQARYLENDALKAIENSQHRIYAMSLIHQKLYQSDDIKTIDMVDYIPDLVKSLEDSFGTLDQIEFKLNIDKVSLDISHAIPLGLIINEAVTNSIKYAFPNYRKGEISILMTDNGQKIKLELADNGIGMPHIDFGDEPESLGLRLMKGLSEDIDADISFEVDNGTRISITFEHDAFSGPENLLNVPQTKEIYV